MGCIILMFSVSVFSQYRTKRRQFLEGFKIQPKAGVNMFFGDLVSEDRTNYVFGVAAEKELLPYLNARADLNYGSMKGTQLFAETNLPYANFDNSFIQFSLGATFRPLDLSLGLFKQRLFKPYIIGQAGILQYSATEYWGEAGHGEAGTVWREVSGASPVISFGGGVNYFWNSHISVTAEFVGSAIFGDEVDGHKEWYSVDGSVTYPTDSNDFFYVATLGITYLFDDSQWRNSPKYNRKAYLKTRSLYKRSRTKYRRPSKRKTRLYKK
ncbi:outer membrane beta-barrel protein [Saccharicrinis sp. GN24d3]|uniref:outer membrane beta-barrel protein n=1 Tax=Saccharicrinis sp. GN24d3 TaxID=3458416 RepID=UPI0040375339